MASADSFETKNPLFIQGKCFNGCEATLIVGEEKTQLYACKEELAKLSDYFRVLFFGDFKEKKQIEFVIDETPEDMICFFNALDPHTYIKKISDDSIELLMRLADKFQSDVLKKCLKEYIEINGPNRNNNQITSNWYICSRQYNMPEEMVNFCAKILKIGDDSIELVMRLTDEYPCDLLKERLKDYIENTGYQTSDLTRVNWLDWFKQYNMPEEIVKVCLDLHNIDVTNVESLMRWANEYQHDVLKEQLRNFIKNVGHWEWISGLTRVNWLFWSKQYNMPQQIVKVSLDVQKIDGTNIESLMHWADNTNVMC